MTDDAFRLEIENHSETQLLQTLQLEQRGAVQIVKLFERYYLLERYQGVRRPPVEIESPSLRGKLQLGLKLKAEDIENELPPLQGIDVLVSDQPSSRLRTAMARFAEENPETAERLHSLAMHPHAAYAAQQSSGMGAAPAQTAPEAAPSPGQEKPKDTVAESSEIHDSPRLEERTQNAVYSALTQAKANQSRLLEQATHMRAELEAQTQQVNTALEVLPQLQSKIDSLKLRLEDWQSQMEHYHFGRDSLLERTADELAQLQGQLRSLLSGGLALQSVVREQRFHEQEDMNERLECLEDMIEHVVQQRHWVYYLQQQQAFMHLEQERAEQVKIREQELQQRIHSLKQSIAEIEALNTKIIAANPLAVPEPIPVLAIHELSRLEHELEMVQADPALKLIAQEEQ